MATPLIIQRSDFTGRVELSSNMTDAKINPRILEAEDFDLRELMGNSFYYSFMDSFNPDGSQKSDASDAYKDLFTGKEYEVRDVMYRFDGIKPVLVYMASARLIKMLDLHLTPNAVMQKRNDFSDHMEGKEKTYQGHQYYNQGLSYWNMIVLFLDNNNSDYPLWKNYCGCTNERTSPRPRMTAVGHNEELNYGYYGRR